MFINRFCGSLCTFTHICILMDKLPLSVVIITFNEERNIARCLDSVSNLADEVLVVDSYSKDRTKELALERGAKFVEHPFEGHIQQKNWAWEQASNEWVLSLDADEALDQTLAQSIRELLLGSPENEGYTMNRLTNYCGHWVKHSGWYPDTKMRLFRKGKGAWGGVNPHDKFELNSKEAGGHLTGDILHYSYYTREDHLKQIEYFSNIASLELHEQGKSIATPMIWLKVVAQYVKNLILKTGFLDGKTGFTIARLSAYATFRKYTKLQQRNAGSFE